VERVKETIVSLKEAVHTAKDKQKEAQEECKKLERDMDEFKNNKEGKIEELKVRLIFFFFFLDSFAFRLFCFPSSLSGLPPAFGLTFLAYQPEGRRTWRFDLGPIYSCIYFHHSLAISSYHHRPSIAVTL